MPPSKKQFREAIEFLSDEQYDLLMWLYDNGQKHLFDEDVFDVSAPPAMRRQLATQLEAIDDNYEDGGLKGYLENAKKLLEDSRVGVNPLADWEPSVPNGQFFKLGTEEYKATEAKGLEELGNVGFVLVAGGLGERLGYSGIKLALPTEMTTQTCYLQYYIEYILAVQKKYAPEGRELPLCIMTSNDTNFRTVQLLENKNNFGMSDSQITIVQQGAGVPALMDNDATIAVINNGQDYLIQTKPHGHGDIHELLYKHGVAEAWLDMGIRYLVMFQDTNGLAFHTLPLMLGVSRNLGLIMNSLAVPRKAKQAIGGITKLTNKKTGETKTINVEYNQLDPLLRASGFPDGDVNDPKTGYSPYPGNINQLLFKLYAYVEILDRTRGLMPEFVNPKYEDETKTKFKKPTRLECMMQDFPTVLESKETEKVGFTSISASLCFSPVKNTIADGIKLQEQGMQPGTAATGEADQYAAIRKIMNSIGCNVETAKKKKFAGIEIHPGAAIILKPDFVCCPAEYRKKFPFPQSINISSRSTLIVRGSGVVIESLDLDGTLVIDYRDGREEIVRFKKVHNDGCVLEKDEDSTDEVIRMRGYSIVNMEAEKMEPNDWCVCS